MNDIELYALDTGRHTAFLKIQDKVGDIEDNALTRRLDYGWRCCDGRIFNGLGASHGFGFRD
jgi:hypothetical protein